MCHFGAQKLYLKVNAWPQITIDLQEYDIYILIIVMNYSKGYICWTT